MAAGAPAVATISLSMLFPFLRGMRAARHQKNWPSHRRGRPGCQKQAQISAACPEVFFSIAVTTAEAASAMIMNQKALS